MNDNVTDDRANPNTLTYATPERPRRGQLITLLLVMSLVHFFGLGLLTAGLRRPAAPAGEWLLYLLAFPTYVVVKLGWTVPSHPAPFMVAVMLITSLLYGAALTVGALTIRRLLKR